MDTLLEAAPGLERFSDLLLTKLKEEIVQCEDSRYTHATIELISQIQEKWRNDS